ncbi:hypothetical protein ACSNOJ_08080 [Streptomyces sp. URMC 128]|uniref:hypothetical protein n=1 Tax=Streptomyces sp. URMC 128 TaxID=3423404 RepID=UPI003F198A61
MRSGESRRATGPTTLDAGGRGGDAAAHLGQRGYIPVGTKIRPGRSRRVGKL